MFHLEITTRNNPDGMITAIDNASPSPIYDPYTPSSGREPFGPPLRSLCIREWNTYRTASPCNTENVIEHPIPEMNTISYGNYPQFRNNCLCLFNNGIVI
ncbi:MAG: hypothetical protein IPN88_14115 [Bacteroidetes bacterium]|nr:hypothetical protein [Bacteroidota bacterium]